MKAYLTSVTAGVARVPPAVEPEFGVMDETAGAGLVEVSKNSSIFDAVADAPGKLVSPKASDVILSVF